MPTLNAAVVALNSLSRNDIIEVRSYTKPPALVQKVMECVCLLLGEKQDWPSAKKLLNDARFLDHLVAYDKDAIPPKVWPTPLQLNRRALLTAAY